ncbi:MULTISPECIES: hypothetical protein [unclassified Wolbachia]|uniref:hypothetical protein n=1 Tax=unclassified Wolbachia TaxID=2640676 RepID=UPI0022319214|nr:hypothetical protein [Wolbachia endosymbiont (group A) of Macropis europaea]
MSQELGSFDPIWGRPEIEGRMIANKYDVELYFYGISEAISGEDIQKIIVTKITSNDGDPEVFMEGEDLDKLKINCNEKFVGIVNYRNHFVPLLNNIEKDIEKNEEVPREEVYGMECMIQENIPKQDMSQITTFHSRDSNSRELDSNHKRTTVVEPETDTNQTATEINKQKTGWKESKKLFYTSLKNDAIGIMITGLLIAATIVVPSIVGAVIFGAVAALCAVTTVLHIKNSTLPSYRKIEEPEVEAHGQRELFPSSRN